MPVHIFHIRLPSWIWLLVDWGKKIFAEWVGVKWEKWASGEGEGYFSPAHTQLLHQASTSPASVLQNGSIENLVDLALFYNTACTLQARKYWTYNLPMFTKKCTCVPGTSPTNFLFCKHMQVIDPRFSWVCADSHQTLHILLTKLGRWYISKGPFHNQKINNLQLGYFLFHIYSSAF